MKSFSLQEIANRINGQIEGDPNVQICRICPPEEADNRAIGVVLEQKMLDNLTDSDAGALVMQKTSDCPVQNVIYVDDPRFAFNQLLEMFNQVEYLEKGVHPTAVISAEAELGPEVSIGAGVYVSPGARIGARVMVYPNAYIGRSDIGEDCQIMPGVAIYSNCKIGKRVLIHSGAVIGSDGFGFQKDKKGIYQKIRQIGAVEIGDDVEIGANCVIDRATIGSTRIGSGTKFDNLVQVGHNTIIGDHCCIIAQVGISGSVNIGNHCVLAGQVGIRDHITLEDNVTVGAKSGVMNDLSSGEWVGYPALKAGQAFRVYTLLSKLPEYRRRIRDLEKRCADLEEHFSEVE